MIGHIGETVGFSVIIVSATVGLADFVWVFTPRRLGRQKLGPIILGAVGLILVGFAVLWFSQIRPEPRTATKTAPPATTLFVECSPSFSPRTMPAEGIWSLTVNADPLGGGGLSYASGILGSEWPTIAGFKCAVTNYGKSTVAGVELIAKIQAIGGPAKDVTLAIPKIDPGKDSPFVFYMSNDSRAHVAIQFGPTARLTIIGEHTPKDVPVGQTAPLTLHPRSDVQLPRPQPAAVPPTRVAPPPAATPAAARADPATIARLVALTTEGAELGRVWREKKIDDDKFKQKVSDWSHRVLEFLGPINPVYAFRFAGSRPRYDVVEGTPNADTLVAYNKLQADIDTLVAIAKDMDHETD
jgi:hypothetical protein